MKKIFLTIIFISLPLFGQGNVHEVNSEVKELSQFHDVIYQIWHTGWPEKNIKFLESLLPDVEKGFAEIKMAELPGILRDKKTKWDEGITKFAACVDAYKLAVDKKDSVSLLNAAEKLHSQFEMLVRTIKPVLKEVDAFHQTLYMLYHYYTPNYDYEKIKESAETMAVKMEGLNKAQLSARMKSREEKFNSAKTDLKIAVKKLNGIVKSNDKKEIESAVNLVHSKYTELEKVFD